MPITKDCCVECKFLKIDEEDINHLLCDEGEDKNEIIEELVAREKILKLEVKTNGKFLTIINNEGNYVYNKKLKMYICKTNKMLIDTSYTFFSEGIWCNYLRINKVVQTDNKKEFASKCLFDFMSAINKCGFHKSHHKLIECATNICLLYSLSNYDDVGKTYKQFVKLMDDCETNIDIIDTICKIIEQLKLPKSIY